MSARRRPDEAVGEGNHVVKPGECVSSIAFEAGFFWQTLWDDPENATLKEARGAPNVLLPGDRLHVPEKREKEVPCETGARHRFTRKGVPELFRLRISDQGDESLAGEPYLLDVEGATQEGEIPEDGVLELRIPPDARRGILILRRTGEEFELRLGGLDPADTTSGMQARLNDLGYECGAADGDPGERTREAIRAFLEDEYPDVDETPSDPQEGRVRERFGL